MRFTPLVLLFLAALLSGCATTGSVDSVRYEVDTVKTRLFTVERDLSGIRDESKSGIDNVQKNFTTDVAAVRKLSADIQATIDSTKSEMQSLNGRVDDMSNTIKKPSADLARYQEDADRRILTLEERILKLQAALDELTKKTGDGGTGAADTSTPEALYMKGLEIYKNGDMPAARDLFTRFLEKQPKHDLAANAHYWIGETYYGEKNFEPAILAYQEVIKQYPKKEKVPAAMLKQAMSFKAINDIKSAKYVLKKLLEGFPKSEEAKKGRELQKELR